MMCYKNELEIKTMLNAGLTCLVPQIFSVLELFSSHRVNVTKIAMTSHINTFSSNLTRP
jgi:hypothetical protein